MKRRLLITISTIMSLIFLLTSCAKDTGSTNEDGNGIIETVLNSVSDEKDGVAVVSENLNLISEDSYTYKTSTIQLENDIESINRIIEKDGIVYGNGYAVDENLQGLNKFFSIKLDDSSLYYYPYIHTVGNDVITMAVNSQQEIFFISRELIPALNQENFDYSYTLYMIDTDGNIQISINLDNYIVGDYPPTLALDNKNNLFLQTIDSIFVFDKMGSPVFEIELGDEYYNYHPLVSLYDGSVCVPIIDGDTLVINMIDEETNELRQIATLPASGEYTICSGFDEDNALYLINDKGAVSYSFSIDESKNIIDLIDIGIEYFWTGSWCILSPNQLAVLCFDTYMNTKEVTILTKTELSLNQKTIITIGSIAPDTSTISRFNRSSESYKLELIDYSESVTSYDEAREKLTMAILTGDAPDIIDLRGLEYEEYARSGILTDLSSYFEEDENMSIDSLVNGVVEALAFDGKIFAMAPEFAIMTIFGESSSVGHDTNIRLDEMIELAEKTKDEKTIFNSMGSSEFMYLYCAANLDYFIDYEKSITNFDSDEFIRALEFSMHFYHGAKEIIPTVTDEESIKNGESIMMFGWIENISDLYLLEVEKIGKEMTVTGIPANENSGNVMFTDILYGICSTSENPEGAWEFIKYLLSEEYQQNNVMSLPVLESTYYTEIDRWMNPVNEENNPHIAEVFYPAMTKEQADELFDVIATMVGYSRYNTTILSIIEEELVPFFSGDKNVETVVGIINNRVSVFLSERT